MKLVVFGDSILKGVITIPGSSKLFDVTENDSLSLAQKKLGFELDNRSIYGNISTKGLLKLKKYLEKCSSGELEAADFCIIEFGSNDCDYDWGTLIQKVPLAEYLQSLKEMVSLCRAHKITPLSMGLIPYVCDDWFKTIIKGQDEKAILTFLNGRPETLGENQLIYKKALDNFIKENQIQYLDPWPLFENHKDLMCYDGIHPNEKGYEVLSQAWVNFLSEVKKEFS